MAIIPKQKSEPVELHVDPQGLHWIAEPGMPLEDPQERKQRQIQAQGAIQAAVKSQALVMLTGATDWDSWWKAVEKTALAQMKFVKENY